MSDTLTSPTEAPPAPRPAKPVWLETIYRHGLGWAQFAVTTLLVDVFLLFESTLDIRIYGTEHLRAVKRAGHSPLLVMWHGQGLLPMASLRREQLCLYASNARDGHIPHTLLALRWWTLRFIERLGYQVLDASDFKSESRGVMRFVDMLRAGVGSVIAADGPLGPIYKAKPGPTFLAKKSGVILLPVGVGISRGWRLDHWDEFQIPWPFARAILIIGSPITVESNARDEALEKARLTLETRMNDLVAAAENRVDQWQQSAIRR